MLALLYYSLRQMVCTTTLVTWTFVSIHHILVTDIFVESVVELWKFTSQVVSKSMTEDSVTVSLFVRMSNRESNKSVRWTGLSLWQHWQSPSKSVFLSIFYWSVQKGSYPPNRGRSCCLVACPPGSRTPARPPPEGSECCSPCLPHCIRSYTEVIPDHTKSYTEVIYIPRPH